MSDKQDKFSQGINVPALVLIVLVGAMLTYVTVVGVQAYYEAGLRREEQTKIIAPQYQPLLDLKEGQVGNLTTTGWIDKGEHLAHVPIEQGMAEAIVKYGKQP